MIKLYLLLALTLLSTTSANEEHPIILVHGYITKIRCEGRLFVSAVGNDEIVALEALPKEIGCGVLLKPLSKSGRTNLFLETSTGTIKKILQIEPVITGPGSSQFIVAVKADAS